MSNNKDELFLPTRDFLRQLIAQQYVKQSELKNILRNRGVFSSNDDKKLLGGALIKTGLSAEEFLILKESYKSKEENPKLYTRKIIWSSDTSLFEALDNDIDFNQLLDDDFNTTKLSNSPIFTIANDDPNYIQIDFEIERHDVTKNWGDHKTYHKGYLELKREDNNPEVEVTLCHTSKEIKEFGNKLIKRLIKDFKKNNYITDNEQLVSIRLHDFDNTGRVKFLNELSVKWIINELYFKDTKDLQFSPDSFDDKTPDDLTWMKDKIEDLKLKGKDIHSTFFVSNKDYHKYIKLYKVSCDYEFSEAEYNGTCRINYEFPDIENENSELCLDISNLNIQKNDLGLSRDQLKTRLLRMLDKKKLELYEKYRIRKTPANLIN